MQPRVRRHRAQPRGPAPEQELDELAAIFERQQHPVARHEALRTQSACQPRDAFGQLAVGSRRAVVADRRPVGQPARDIEQQRCQVGHEIVTPLSTGSTWPVTMRNLSLAR